MKLKSINFSKIGRILIVVFSMTVLLTNSFSQDREILIKSAILTAEHDILDKQYRSALRNVEKVKQLSGEYMPKLHYLAMKAYIGLNYYDDARKEIKSYFDIAKEDDSHFNEMVLMISKIDDIELGQEKEKIEISQKRDQEQEEWEKTQKINTIDAYKTFLRTYPNSENASIANQNINHFSNLFLKENKELQDKYFKDYKRKKTLKRLLGWGGVGIGLVSFGRFLYTMGNEIPDFPYIEKEYCDYDIWSGSFNCSYERQLSPFAIGTLVGAGLMTTSFFISTKKRKKLFEDQKSKVNELERNLSFGLTLLNASNSKSIAYSPGINIKFSF